MSGLERRLGSYFCPAPRSGPRADQGILFVAVGGIHGNEPAGVHAIRRVLADLQRLELPIHGYFVGLAGNLRALAEGERFSRRDLNRVWTDEEVARLRVGDIADEEGHEQAELLDELDPLMLRSWKRIVLLDLHSTSAQGSPFSIMADSLQNRRVAFALPIPVILGLEERVEGTLLSYFSDRGHTALCVEGGQNEEASTVDHHESALWLSMVACGLMDASVAPELERHRARLRRASRGTPAVVELRYRQDVPVDGDYEMCPGFENFQRVSKGETLGHLRVGDRPDGDPSAGPRRAVRTPLDGLVLMPRYQGRGNDAFFVGRVVRPFWLRVSSWCRRLQLDDLLPLLPGIERSPDGARVLDVNLSVARWYALEILHLFGYRRKQRNGMHLVFVRRKDVV